MKKNMIGALVLSATLSLGMVGTAFADPVAEVVGGGSPDGDKTIVNTQADGKNTGVGSGNTDVYLQAVTNQVNATIPLSVYAVADIDGGDMVMPEKTAYKITNNSTAGALYVTQVQAALDNSGSINGWSGIGSKTNLATQAEKTVYMSLQPDGVAEPIILTSADSTTKIVTPVSPAKSLWSIAKKTGENGTTCGIQLAGANSALGSNLDSSMTKENGTAVKFMTITYTVSMKAHDLTTE